MIIDFLSVLNRSLEGVRSGLAVVVNYPGTDLSCTLPAVEGVAGMKGNR